jgi:hypothetical protein
LALLRLPSRYLRRSSLIWTSIPISTEFLKQEFKIRRHQFVCFLKPTFPFYFIFKN